MHPYREDNNALSWSAWTHRVYKKVHYCKKIFSMLARIGCCFGLWKTMHIVSKIFIILMDFFMENHYQNSNFFLQGTNTNLSKKTKACVINSLAKEGGLKKWITVPRWTCITSIKHQHTSLSTYLPIITSTKI